MLESVYPRILTNDINDKCCTSVSLKLKNRTTFIAELKNSVFAKWVEFLSCSLPISYGCQLKGQDKINTKCTYRPYIVCYNMKNISRFHPFYTYKAKGWPICFDKPFMSEFKPCQSLDVRTFCLISQKMSDLFYILNILTLYVVITQFVLYVRSFVV